MMYFRLAAIALITFLFTVSVMVEPASAVDSTSVVLAWDPSPDPGIRGYKIYRTENSGSFPSPALNGSTLVTGSTFTDSTGQAGRTYYYAVTAVSSTGLESNRSNTVQATIVAPAPAPPAPMPPPLNLAPAVSAGADKTISLPASASLTATAADDGLPTGKLSYRWSQLQGSPATFSSPLSAATQVSFPGAGAYSLRVTVTDGQLSSADDVVINVQSASNRAPTVSAGPDQNIALSASAKVTATATDDGLPNGKLTYQWSVIQGSRATFTSPQAPGTQISFPLAGAYTLRVTVTDGQLTSSDDVVINVQPSANRPPTVSAGPDRDITLPASVSLTVTVSDDRLLGPLTYQWSAIKGSGITFQSPRSATTQVLFAKSGVFPLRVTVSDGQLTSSDDVVVTVRRKFFGNKSSPTTQTTVNTNLAVTNRVASGISPVTPESEDVAETDFLLLGPQATSAPALELAVMEYNHNSTRLSDAVFKSTTPIRNGRIYALMQESTNTGIAIANPNSEQVVINFSYADAAGKPVYTSQLLLPPGGKSSTFIDESPLRPQSATDLSRIQSFSFSASAPVAAAAVRILTNERKDFVMTSIPIANLDQAEGPLTFPFYADGAGWQSEIQLVNTTSSTLYGNVQLFPSLKSSGPDFTYAIPPNAAVALHTPGLASQTATGWVQITPEADTPSPAGSLILSHKTNGVTTSLGTVVSTPASPFYHVYVETSGGNQGEPGSVQTTLSIANPASNPASVTFEVLTMNWQSTERRRAVTIEPHGNLTLTLNQIPGMEAVTQFKGIVRIGGDPATVAGFLARYGDFGQVVVTSLPAIGISMGPSASEPRFLFTAEGGGFVTDLKDVNSLGHLSDALD